MLDLPSTSTDERTRTTSILEGDVVVLSLDEPTPTCPGSVEAAGLFTSDKAESGKDDTAGAPMAPSTRLKYSRFRGDGSQDADDWYCEFESIATAD